MLRERYIYQNPWKLGVSSMYHTVIAGFYGSKNNKFQKFSDSHYHVQNLLVLLSVSFSVLEPYSSIAYTGSEIE